MLTAVFVYGTLKQGQCRETLWPCLPRSVRPGWVSGSLFARHDYPAMTLGADRVLGECWEFLPAEMPRVLHVLDQIEGTNQPGVDDLYHRVRVEVYAVNGHRIGPAFGYHYASDPLEDGFTPVYPPEPNALLQWP